MIDIQIEPKNNLNMIFSQCAGFYGTAFKINEDLEES